MSTPSSSRQLPPAQSHSRRYYGFEFLAVFIGGAVGSVTRDLITPLIALPAMVPATFAVNVLACLLIGWLFAVRHRMHAHFMHLCAVGFCGGMSTFSSLAADVAMRVQAGVYFDALRAPVIEIAIGIGAAIIGEAIGRRYHSGPTSNAAPR